MSKIIKGFGVLSLIASPFMALATAPDGVAVGGPTIFNLLGTISSIMNVVIPILITAAVIYVIAGVIKYVTASDSDGQAEGRTMIISGIVGLFVIVSIWGLVAILNSTFGINQGGQNILSTDCAEGTIIGYDAAGNPILCGN
jgi:hypothetical protein